MNSRVAVVTGGTAGLGAAIAERLGRDGFRVVVVHRGAKRTQVRFTDPGADPRSSTSIPIRGSESASASGGNGRLVHLHGDVTVEEDVRRLVQQACACGEIRAWVNAVGDFAEQPVGQATLEVWDRILRSNLISAMLCCREVIPAMRPHGGSIVNLGVARAGTVRATPNALPYTIAKNGLVALSLTLAKTEGPYNIRVNVVNPGFIEGGKHSPTYEASRIPLGRLGGANDVANAVSFLISEQASYITGAVLGVDGGVFL